MAATDGPADLLVEDLPVAVMAAASRAEVDPSVAEERREVGDCKATAESHSPSSDLRVTRARRGTKISRAHWTRS